MRIQYDRVAFIDLGEKSAKHKLETQLIRDHLTKGHGDLLLMHFECCHFASEKS